MKAVVIKGLKEVALEDRPLPKIEDERDVIIKVQIAGLCGSDLHNYRQAEPGTGFILGHEMVGEIIEAGPKVEKYKVGDVVAAPFSICCGTCWYCEKGYTPRCPNGTFFGHSGLPGCQAEYIRHPLADGSLIAVPKDGRTSKEDMLLLCDIFSTGYSAAWNAKTMLDNDEANAGLPTSSKVPKDRIAVIFGCGPVGLCAISSAKSLFSTVYATDPNAARREIAEKHGAIALPFDELRKELEKATEGRGADAVLDVVGGAGVVGSCIEVVRSCGVVVSIGMQSKVGEIDFVSLYDKNIRLQFGRSNVRQFFPKAREVLNANRELFEGFITHRVRFEQAAEYYSLFNDGKVGKTVFVADSYPLEKS